MTISNCTTLSGENRRLRLYNIDQVGKTLDQESEDLWSTSGSAKWLCGLLQLIYLSGSKFPNGIGPQDLSPPSIPEIVSI